MASKSWTQPRSMPLIGIGIDIQSIRHLAEALERQGERMIHKVFTAYERDYCQERPHASQHFAARWAIKEAFYKAVSEHLITPFRFTDVETRLTPQGKPYLMLHGTLRELAQCRGMHFHISLSHSGDYAAGIVLAMGETEGETGKEWAT